MPTHNTKPTRYMDFISRKPSENSDPLASRPDSRPVKHPKPIAKPTSVADQIPPKGSHIEKTEHAKMPAKAPRKEPELTVKKDTSKPYISREPAKSRDLYAEAIDPSKPKTEPKKAAANDDLAIKASAALSGTSQPAEKSSSSPDGNAYSLGGKSPFLPHYNIDKRPLSNSVPKKNGEQFEKLSYLGVSEQGHDSARKKNIYHRSEKSDDPKESKDRKEKAVKIIDNDSEKRGVPIWLIIIITIILGAAAGAGVYFLLP